MTTLTFNVNGIPGAQGSKRHVGHGVMVESSAKVKPWRSDVKAAAEAALIASDTWERATGPVAVVIEFRFTRPKAHYRTGRNAHLLRDDAPAYCTSRGAGDIDKLERSSNDALVAAGVMLDDSLIVSSRCIKRYCDPEQPAGATFRISPIVEAPVRAPCGIDGCDMATRPSSFRSLDAPPSGPTRAGAPSTSATAGENSHRGADARWQEDCPNGHPAPLYRRTLPSGKTICGECRRLGDLARDERDRDKRRAAARDRYARQQRDVDEVAVERRAAGDHTVALTRAERLLAVQHLHAAGMNDQQIADRLGYAARTVLRDRQHLDLPANEQTGKHRTTHQKQGDAA